jgi:integrase
MATMKLTQAAVDALVPGATAYLTYDSDLVGFAVRTNPTGLKVWLIEYRPNGGGRGVIKRRFKLGPVSTMTAGDARTKARKLLGGVANDRDPAHDRAEQRASLTVSELAERYLTEEIEAKRKRRTAELYRGYFRCHIEPALGTRKARDVVFSDTARLHRQIAAKGHPINANRVIQFVSSLYAWGAKIKAVPDGFNPVKGLERFKEKGRERYLSDDELARLGETLTLAETDGLPFPIDEDRPTAKHAPKPENRITVISEHATNAIRLLAFTGCRLREILHLRWTDVDLARAVFTLPDSKTGRRTVYLNAPALAVLDRLREIALGDYVIAGDQADKPRADLQRPWSQVVRHAQLDGVTLHTLRHTHASVGVGQNIGLPLVGALLGHKQHSTTMRYAHIAQSPARGASETIGSALAAAMGGKVVAMKRRRRAA